MGSGVDAGEAALRAILDGLTESQIETLIEDGLQFIEEEADDLSRSTLSAFMAREYPDCVDQEDMELDCTIYDSWQTADGVMETHEMEWDTFVEFIESEAEA